MMLKKILVQLRYLIFGIVALTIVVACENDFTNIGVDLVDSNLFSTLKYDAQVHGWTVDIDKNITNDISNFYLGYDQNTHFGSLRASIVTQLTLPESNPDFGENAVIDSVIITIPYYSTLDGKQSVTDPNDATKTITVPNYSLDSVWTSGENKFQLKIWELGTYINPYNPTNPSLINEFYSNNTYLKTGSPLYDGNITPTANDTMAVIKRYKYTNTTLSERVMYDKDTIKLTNAKPAIKIALDENYIKSVFQDNASGTHFANNDNFRHFFRGFYFEALPISGSNALIYFNVAEANMTIYYTENKIEDEGADEDLNSNGIKGEQNVLVIDSNKFIFPFTGLKANLYERNHTGSLVQNYITNPNTVSGNDKIFINGTAGTDAVIHLFGSDSNANQIPDQIDQLRTKNWLINDAQLYLYVDKDNYTTHYPEKLYIYAFKEGLKQQSLDVLAYNTIGSPTYIFEGISKIDGKLYYDANNKPDYYKFHLTKYVAEILKPDTEEIITDFGIKTYDVQDVPIYLSDTIMRKYNTNFKGIVLQGTSNTNQERNLKLEIYYTEKN